MYKYECPYCRTKRWNGLGPNESTYPTWDFGTGSALYLMGGWLEIYSGGAATWLTGDYITGQQMSGTYSKRHNSILTWCCSTGRTSWILHGTLWLIVNYKNGKDPYGPFQRLWDNRQTQALSSPLPMAEAFITGPIPANWRRVMAALRMGCLSLEVETGQFGCAAPPLQQRICKLCSTDVENEEHFLLHCHDLKEERKNLFNAMCRTEWNKFLCLNNPLITNDAI